MPILILFLIILQAAFASFNVSFNKPGLSGGSDDTIDKEIVRTIDLALPGSSIHIAHFLFDRPELGIPLVAASARGVKIHLVLDGRNILTTANNATDLVLKNCPNSECITFCKGPFYGIKIKNQIFGGSCLGSGINHNKFYLFSELSDGRRNVVLQTSANGFFTHLKKYNDLLIIQDKDTYEGYLNYWKRLSTGRLSLRTPKGFYGGNLESHLSPRVLGKDPVLSILKKVDCSAPSSSIKVLHVTFTRSKVARALKQLSLKGCHVDIIAQEDKSQGSPSKKVTNALGNLMRIIPSSGNMIHTKIILIDAKYNGSQEKEKLVLTGSHNLDFFSLRTNDEVLLEIKDSGLYQKYLSFWKELSDLI